AFPDLVDDAICAVAEGRAIRSRQDGQCGTYFPGRREGDEWLDWSDSSRNLHNKVRAITRPRPGARTTLGGTPVIIWRAFYDPEWPTSIATPGCVVGRRSEGPLIKTGDSLLLVTEAQASGESGGVPSWRLGVRLEDPTTDLLRREGASQPISVAEDP